MVQMDMNFDLELLNVIHPVNLDLRVLDYYKDNAEAINWSLYGDGPVTSVYKRMTERLDHLFTLSPKFDKPTTLYRGINNETLEMFDVGGSDIYEFKTFLLENIGKDVCFASFLSTSYDPVIASHFSSGLILKLHIVTQIPYIPIDEWLKASVSDSEKEIVLPRNLSFHLDSSDEVTFLSKRYTILTMTSIT